MPADFFSAVVSCLCVTSESIGCLVNESSFELNSHEHFKTVPYDVVCYDIITSNICLATTFAVVFACQAFFFPFLTHSLDPLFVCRFNFPLREQIMIVSFAMGAILSLFLFSSGESVEWSGHKLILITNMKTQNSARVIQPNLPQADEFHSVQKRFRSFVIGVVWTIYAMFFFCIWGLPDKEKEKRLRKEGREKRRKETLNEDNINSGDSNSNDIEMTMTMTMNMTTNTTKTMDMTPITTTTEPSPSSEQQHMTQELDKMADRNFAALLEVSHNATNLPGSGFSNTHPHTLLR